MKPEAPPSKPAPLKPAPLKPAPFKPRPLLFAILLVVTVLWIGALVVMYFTTVHGRSALTPAP